MNQIKEYKEKTFEDIKYIDEYGNEYWKARELMLLFEYKKWENFHKVIKRAMVACDTSKYSILDHFPEVGIETKNKRKIVDYNLSRYACYLIVQNADSRKENVALCKTYIAMQTRKAELRESKYINDFDDEVAMEELATKLFINSLTESKMKKENIKTKSDVEKTYSEVNKAVRDTINQLHNSFPKKIINTKNH